MALHRDIFWVGRQWAVTGFGIQAVDQRLRGVLDIEVARLWDDDFVQSRRAKPGINAEDFDKALTVARTRHPQAAASIAVAAKPAPVPSAPRTAEAVRVNGSAEEGSLLAMLSKLEPANIPAPPPVAPKVSPPPVRPPLQLRAEGRLARFLPQWRIRR
ncbi:hypothetical protein [Bradyrhizobium liaoningense]|uniref:hypothetical protein n=1 Tax=Bradyrhizobium liaoningense TaxID=43992 RepID=UPI001BACD985|nr:hypothetical protein [Bradyrhizobium liaoningense]MBR0716193.1 hypothetical protein [Bradyrhizobium liaoningense]